MARATSPTGSPIKGTLQRVDGVAMIDEFSFRKDGDRIDFEYSGYTDIEWNSQESIRRRGRRVYVDEAGDVWPEDKLEVSDDFDDDEG